MYTNFFEYREKEKPTVMLEAIEPYSGKAVAGHDVLAVPVKHSAPTVGYHVSSPDGRSLCYTGGYHSGSI